MSSDLKLDWCSHEAAKFACLNWHYSKTMPVSKSVRVGVWEKGEFIGAVMYSWGGNHNIGSPYGLTMLECCELVRVALKKHEAPVSRILAISFRMIRVKSPNLRLIISFADPVAGHAGGIYQAGGWIYTGTSKPSFEYWHNGKRLQKRAYTGANYGKAKMVLPIGAKKIATPGKHRYLMPLDDEMRRRVEPLRKPYPKKPCAGSETVTRPPIQAGEGGSIPTPALKEEKHG